MVWSACGCWPCSAALPSAAQGARVRQHARQEMHGRWHIVHMQACCIAFRHPTRSSAVPSCRWARTAALRGRRTRTTPTQQTTPQQAQRVRLRHRQPRLERRAPNLRLPRRLGTRRARQAALGRRPQRPLDPCPAGPARGPACGLARAHYVRRRRRRRTRATSTHTAMSTSTAPCSRTRCAWHPSSLAVCCEWNRRATELLGLKAESKARTHACRALPWPIRS